MVHKKSLLVLLMIGLVGLSGCWRRRRVVVEEAENKQQPRREAVYTRPVEMPVAGATKELEYDETVSNFYDQDLNELVTLAQEDKLASERSLDDLDQDFALVEPSVNEDTFKTVYFDFDKHRVRKDQETLVRENIEKAKRLLEEKPSEQATLVIEGHCDEPGSPSYNLALSEKRAKEVADRCRQAGIEHIKVVGRGKDMPVIATGQKEELNRRVEMHVIYS